MSLSTPINHSTNNNDFSNLNNSLENLSTPIGQANTPSQYSTPINSTAQFQQQNLPEIPQTTQPPAQPNFNKPMNNDLLNDILNDIDNDNSIGNDKMDDIHNMNMSTYNYSMDESQVPNEERPPTSDNLNDISSENFNNNNFIVNHNTKPESSFSFFGLFNYKYDDIITPIIVFIIVFLLSLTQVNRFIFSLCPQFLKESGQVNIYGVILKGFIGMISYLFIKFGSKIILSNNNN